MSFRDVVREMDDEPGYTCPIIDKAIGTLEEIREANAAIRSWGEDWKAKAEEFYDRVQELEEEERERNVEVAKLEEKVKEKEEEVTILENKIRELKEIITMTGQLVRSQYETV